MADDKEALPRLPEPVAWRGLTQSYPYPQDNDWRYGPWVYDLDPAKYRRLFTEEQMHAFREAGVSELRAEVERLRVDAERYQWLCEHAIVPKPSLWDRGVGFVCDLVGLPMRGAVTKQGLDAAIDTARSVAPGVAAQGSAEAGTSGAHCTVCNSAYGSCGHCG